MPVYEYKALNTHGKQVSGVIDADNSRTARLKLKAEGLFATEIVEDRKAKETSDREVSISAFFERVKRRDVAVMTRQLSTLLGAGLPLVQGLTALIEQTENRLLKRIMTQVKERVNEGGTLADALAEHPRVFSSLFVNMIRAGESSSALEIVLERLADFTENQLTLRNRISSALAYPILMLLVGVSVLTFLLAFVIPTVTRLFEETKQSLPLPTLVLISISSFLKDFWWLILVGLIAFFIAFKSYIKTEKGRVFFDRFKLKVPIFGALIQKISVSRFTRTLAILSSSGIPILGCLQIVKTVVNNVVMSAAIEKAAENISQGEDIASPLKRSGLFPPLVTHMVAVGEKTGELESMLLKVSEAYDNEVETTIQGLTSLLEPVMILVMGAIVGFIVLSILLPIFELNQGVR